jgi:hypothetical protein
MFSRGYVGGLMIIEIAVEIGIETDNGLSISTPIVYLFLTLFPRIYPGKRRSNPAPLD